MAKSAFTFEMGQAPVAATPSPLFENLDALKEWLFAHAVGYDKDKYGTDFALAFSVGNDPADRWRATVQWAVSEGKGAWYVAERPFSYVNGKGECVMPDPIITFLDGDYELELTDGAKEAQAPAPGG